MPAPHLETQQHLSNVLCVNLQTNLPSLISQQHSFTSFPVSLQTIFFGAAANAVAAISKVAAVNPNIECFMYSPRSQDDSTFEAERSQAQRRKKQTFNPEKVSGQAAQRPTSNSEKRFASIRVIRGYKIDHQRSVPDQLHSLRASVRRSEPPATVVSSI
jgi:hypothetical protein